MKATVQLDIVSIEAEIFSGPAAMLVVTAELGELGILPGHTPLLTTIKPGQIRIVLPDDSQDVYYVSGGILDIQPTIVTILADTVVRADDLDEMAAIEAQENAKRALANKQSKVDFTGALAQITQAAAKLRVIQLSNKNITNKRP